MLYARIGHSAAGQQPNNLIENEIRFVVIRGRDVVLRGEGELNEGGQKASTTSYKINKH